MSDDKYSEAVRPMVALLGDAGCEDVGTPPGTPITSAQREALIALALGPGHYGLQFSSEEAHPASYRGPRRLFASVKTDELHGTFYVVNLDGSVRAPDD